MSYNEKLAEVLNDLVQINHDRVAGYEKAFNEAEKINADVKATFSKMAADSKNYASQLKQEVSKLGEEPAKDTTVRGKVYRAWMDVKHAFSSNDRKSILESCEYGEDAAQRAYESALSSDVEMPANVRQLITEQKAELREAHDLIKEYRDNYVLAAN